MKLFAALLAAASSATLGGSFLGAPQPGLSIDASIQDSASAVDLAGSSIGGLNMLAPSGFASASPSLTQAVDTFQHRASIIDDMYDASGTAWLQRSAAPQAESQHPALGMESPMASANMAFPWQNSGQQQQQQHDLQPLPLLQQPAPTLRTQQQLLQMQQPPRQQPQFQQPQMQQLPMQQAQIQEPQMQQLQMQQVAPVGLLQQNQAFPPFPQTEQSSSMTQQSATAFITEPLGSMQPPPTVNADQLFRDPSIPEQSNVVEPSPAQFQGQPQWGGRSLLSLLGQGQGQGFGPTDPPRESPWISMSDPTREPPMQQQFQQANSNMLSFGQMGQPNMISFGQQQMLPFGSGQMQNNIGQSQMTFQPGQMNPDMMGGNPSMMAQPQQNMMGLEGGNPSMMAQPQQNMMALQQQPQPGFLGNTGCILCQSQTAQTAGSISQAPNENKWANYFSKTADDQRKHDEAFE